LIKKFLRPKRSLFWNMSVNFFKQTGGLYLRKVKSSGQLPLIFAIVILGVVFSVLSPHFLGLQNILNILLASSTIGILAIGAAIVIGSAGLDLSVGSIMAFSAAVAGAVMLSLSASGEIMILTCLIAGAFVGFVNGSLVAALKLPAFIVTLGMMSIARGAGFIFTGGRPIYGMPETVVFLGQGSIFGLPMPVIAFLLAAIFGYYLLNHTRFGLHSLCIGDNEKAARNAGVNITSLKIRLYVLSGTFAALSGLIFMGRLNAVDPMAGLTYELTAITAAIIGGTSLFGGRASIAGAVLGAIIMGILQNGLNLLAVPAYYQQLAVGAVLILAVALNRKKESVS